MTNQMRRVIQIRMTTQVIRITIDREVYFNLFFNKFYKINYFYNR